jgi:hypothetical protein
MNERDESRDELSEVLGEWKGIEPSLEFDARVIGAYRRGRLSAWQRFWRGRVSVPVPVVALAAIAVVLLVVWLRPERAPREAGGIVTQIDSDGFQPMPNGAARLIRIEDARQ